MSKKRFKFTWFLWLEVQAKFTWFLQFEADYLFESFFSPRTKFIKVPSYENCAIVCCVCAMIFLSNFLYLTVNKCTFLSYAFSIVKRLTNFHGPHLTWYPAVVFVLLTFDVRPHENWVSIPYKLSLRKILCHTTITFIFIRNPWILILILPCISCLAAITTFAYNSEIILVCCMISLRQWIF